MSDKTNVEEIIGLVKTDEVTNSVEEVRKLRGRGETMSNESIVRDYRLKDDGTWEQLIAYETKDGEVKEWCGCTVVDVSVERLLCTWEDLVSELSLKEVQLAELKEMYNVKEFDIVYKSDIDFKSLYGSTAEKVRKQHAKETLSDLDGGIQALELSVSWIKQYIPLLKEVIRVKGR